MFSVVVLPEPDGPSKREEFAAGDTHVQTGDCEGAAVIGFLDVYEFNEILAAGISAGFGRDGLCG